MWRFIAGEDVRRQVDDWANAIVHDGNDNDEVVNSR